MGAPVPGNVIKALRPSLARRFFTGWLINTGTLLSPARWTKLRSEMAVLARSLMMKRTRQTLTVLARYRGYKKRAIWLRTIAWMPVVLGAALWLNVVNSINPNGV